MAACPTGRGQAEHFSADHPSLDCRCELSHLLADKEHFLAVTRVLGKSAALVMQGRAAAASRGGIAPLRRNGQGKPLSTSAGEHTDSRGALGTLAAVTPRVLLTGGAGYIGVLVADELTRAGHAVRVLDSLAHSQDAVARDLAQADVELMIGDVRDPDARRGALAGAQAVVHLAGVVGDPACARDPEMAREVNVEATRALVQEARAGGIERLVFASTCSNYGRMADPTVPIAEDGQLSPVSLYAEQKVAVERELLSAPADGLLCTCLRFATVYGVAPRMRFDLTVNEFTRDLWADRELEVFGEQFWRPYVHVRDVARAIRTVLQAQPELVGGEVYNVGRSGENYRKQDIVEAIRRHTDSGRVSYVRRDEDPRDYKVAFDKVHERLGFQTEMVLDDGIAEILGALEGGRIADPFDVRHRNTP